MWTYFKFWPMKKHFAKTISQWEFDYGLFTNLPRIILACDFSPISFKFKRGILPLWQNMYPNLKTACHMQLKFFLWTKLREYLLLVKYLISVAATLRNLLSDQHLYQVFLSYLYFWQYYRNSFKLKIL